MTHNQPTIQQKQTFLALVIRCDAQLGRRANSRKISLVIFFYGGYLTLSTRLMLHCKNIAEPIQKLPHTKDANFDAP